MNFSKRNKSIVDFLFIIILFGTFIVTGLVVVLFGAKVYQSTVNKMDANYASRTALSYVTEKIRSHDFSDGASIITNDGSSILILKEKVGDRVFDTYLYVSDGELKEFTASEDYDFVYDAGTKILDVKAFDVDKEGEALYKFNIVDNYDNKTEFYVALYSDSDGDI